MLKKTHFKLISCLLVLSLLASFCACGEADTQTDNATVGEETTMEITEPVTEEQPVPIAAEPADGAEISLLNEQMTAWVRDYKRSQLDKICDFTEKCEPVPVKFYWGDGAEYTNLLISENSDMSDPDVYLCTGDGAEIEDLLPGTVYYWQTVKNVNGADERSDVHTFSTLQSPRTVHIPGVSNVRDLGGKTTTDGKRVKYGLVFRGADFAHLTDEGKRKAVDILGIKTELDLRSKVNNGRSPLGDDVKYISVTAPYYTGVSSADGKAALAEELRVFADPDNLPVYFHCSLGRDRTGTLAFVLLALLGVEEDQVYMDYEVSFFSDMGGYEDRTAPSFMVQQLDSLKSIVSPGKRKPLYEKARAYLLKLGLTDEELDAIRANLLEEIS